MATINLKSLVGKLNSVCRRALEGAAGLCLSRTNYNVEIEHWLVKLLETDNTDLSRIFRQYDVDKSRVVRELTRALDQLKTGNARPPALSPEIQESMREAWVVASLEFGSSRIRSGYLLAALLQDRSLSARVRASSAELGKIAGERLQNEMCTLIAGTVEDEGETVQALSETAGAPGTVSPGSKTPSLDQFTINLTERARKGEIDPVIGRDAEIRQVIDILTRRRQNNPILTGEAGVGKTAVVEGFALRIIAKDVPDSLRNVAIRTLDLGLLQAGAGVKGEFENRLKSVIAEVKASPQPVILFIDEAHTIIGAGGAAGQGDAANLLKPALARGELRTIAATTWAEYKKYFETDAALKRRFQVVKVDEPEEGKAVRMMRGLAGTLEKHHKVRVLDEAVEDAVKLSHRYITERHLPDKAVSLLDTACARVALSQSSTPPALEDCRREIEHINVEIAMLERERAVGADHDQRLQELHERKQTAEARLAALEKRLADENLIVQEIAKLRTQLEDLSFPRPAFSDASEKRADHTLLRSVAKRGSAGEPPAVPTATAPPSPQPLSPAAGERGRGEGTADRGNEETKKRCKEELAKQQAALAKLQGDAPLVHPVVDRQAVADVVSNWTGIPVGKMVLDEIKTVLTLKEKLEERIIGQSHALDAIAQRIRTARATWSIRAGPSASSCWSAPAASAKPRRPWRSRTSSTAATATWWSSTCPSTRRITRFRA